MSVFGIFWRSLSAIDVKNLLKWLARVLLLVTVLLSVVRLMFWNCFVFNINYRSNSIPQFFCILSVIFKIFLEVVFLTDSGSCYYVVPVNFESFLDFSFFVWIGGFAKLFVYSIFYFYRFQKTKDKFGFCFESCRKSSRLTKSISSLRY